MKGLPGMQSVFQQAKKMQEDFAKVQEEAAKKTVEASVGGGMVKVIANGKQEIVKIQIESEILKMGDKEVLEDLVRAGTNEALKSAKEMMQEEMKKLAGNLGPIGSMLGLS